MKRLYLQIYLTAVAIIVLFTVLSCIVWWLAPQTDEVDHLIDGASVVLSDLLPGPGVPPQNCRAPWNATRICFRWSLKSSRPRTIGWLP